jgi:hypothetical protein
MKATMFEGQRSQRQPRPGDNLALEQPSSDLRERGGYDAYVMERSVYTKAAMHPVLAGAVAFGAGLAIASLVRGQRVTEDEYR